MNTFEDMMEFAGKLGIFLATIDDSLTAHELSLEINQLIAGRTKDTVLSDADNMRRFISHVRYAYWWYINNQCSGNNKSTSF